MAVFYVNVENILKPAPWSSLCLWSASKLLATTEWKNRRIFLSLWRSLFNAKTSGVVRFVEFPQHCHTNMPPSVYFVSVFQGGVKW